MASVAVIGATTVYVLGWLVVLIAPMLAVVQALGAHVATVKRRQLQLVVKDYYGVWIAWLLLVPLFAVNLLTIAADLEGGTAALQLLTGADARWFAVPLAALVAFLLVRGKYKQVEGVLKYVPLAFTAYIGAAILAHPNWHEVAIGTFVPHLDFHNIAQTTGAIALLGTTLTAYAYVWITIEVSEEHAPMKLLSILELDAVIGTVTAVVAVWFILIATGATLGVHHRNVETAADAAQALVPLAGKYAGYVFGIGLLGSALLALPVIASTTAYATAAMFRWECKLDDRLSRAPQFYAVILGSLAIAAICGLFNFNAVQLLFFSSIAGGLATPISLAILIAVATSKKAMNGHTAPGWLLLSGWIVTGIVTASAVIYLIQTL